MDSRQGNEVSDLLNQSVPSLPKYVKRNANTPCIDTSAEIARCFTSSRHIHEAVHDPGSQVFCSIEVHVARRELSVIAGQLYPVSGRMGAWGFHVPSLQQTREILPMH